MQGKAPASCHLNPSPPVRAPLRGRPVTERIGAVNPPRPTTAGADKQTQRPRSLSSSFGSSSSSLPCPSSSHLPRLLFACAAAAVARGGRTARGTLGARAGRTDLRPACPRWRAGPASASRNVSSRFATWGCCGSGSLLIFVGFGGICLVRRCVWASAEWRCGGRGVLGGVHGQIGRRFELIR